MTVPKIPFVIAVLGAESTGKTTLALALGQSLTDTLGADKKVTVVSEYLREFCDHHGRTPTQQEQHAIAAEQTRRIRQAASNHDLVIADTTALMTAVYSEQVFGDQTLYDNALADQGECDLILLTALDLPWQADGLQRDGPHVRAPVDSLLRAALFRGQLPFHLVTGQGSSRLENALRSVNHARGESTRVDEPASLPPRWRGWCERCSDPDCERRCLPPIR